MMAEYLYPVWKGWPGNRTALIAEIGVNHGGNESLAWEMIVSAYESGADFVKLQSFVTEEFFHPSLSYYADTKKYELTIDQQRRLFKKAIEKNIKLITTPFDRLSIDVADEFEPIAHKVASMDNDNIPLIKYIAEKQRPVLVSLGMSDMNEAQRVVKIMKEAGNDKLALLHCISDYPTEPKNLNLANIPFLKRIFGCFVGLSDHSLGITSSYIGASFGCAVIEKHFTIDHSLHEKYPDADNNLSIIPQELAALRKFCEEVPVMMGQVPRPLTKNEVAGRKNFRRGLYAKRDIAAGEKLSLENVVFLRPVQGISAGSWDEVENLAAKRTILKLEPVRFSDIGL